MLRIIAVALAIAAWQLTGLEEWAWAYTCGLPALLLIVLEYKGAPAPASKGRRSKKGGCRRWNQPNPTCPV